MTCIVGLVHDGTVYIGGDTLASTHDTRAYPRSDEKVFTLGEFVIGFTTSYRMGQILRYAFTPPPLPGKDPDRYYKYMVVDFVDAVREALKSKGWATKQSEQESGGVFLVGFRGRLFRIDSDYQVAESRDGWDAVGCGAEIARGALFATSKIGPEAHVMTALRAAEYLNTGVRGPFSILSTPPTRP